MSHSKISPSSADRWFKCTMSVSASDGLEESKSDAAIEGTAAHWCAEKMLQGESDTIGQTADNGEIVTDEMWEGAREYYNHIFSVVNNLDGVTMGDVKIEQRVDLEVIAPGCFGTADAYIVAGDVIHVFDFKFGRRPVSAESMQMLCYAIGLADKYGCEKVVCHIVQPRAWHVDGPVRSHTYTKDDLTKKLTSLQQAAIMALDGRGSYNTGDHCRYCLARFKCSAYRTSVYNAVDVVDTIEPVDLDDHMLGLQISMLRQAKDRITEALDSLESEAEEKIRNGHTVNGYALGNGRSSLKWVVDDNEVMSLGELMGVDLRNKKPITPIQAKKLIDDSVIMEYSKRIPGAVKLIPSDETIASRVFKSN